MLSDQTVKLKQSNYTISKEKSEAVAKLKAAEDEVAALKQELDVLKGNIITAIQQSASPMRPKMPPVPPEGGGEAKKLF